MSVCGLMVWCCFEEDGEGKMTVWIDGLVVFEEDGEYEMSVCERGREVLGIFNL